MNTGDNTIPNTTIDVATRRWGPGSDDQVGVAGTVVVGIVGDRRCAVGRCRRACRTEGIPGGTHGRDLVGRQYCGNLAPQPMCAVPYDEHAAPLSVPS